MSEVERDDRWRAIAQSEEFQALVRERRRTSFTLLAVCLGWYGIFLMLVAFAQDFMGRSVFADELTVAYVIGLSQFILTFVVIRLYSTKADGRFSELERKIAERHDAPATGETTTSATAPAPRMGPR